MPEGLKFVILAAALAASVFSRRWSLAIIAIFLPLNKLLPVTSISGLNAQNMLLIPVIMHAFLAGPAPKTPKGRDPLLIPLTILLAMVFASAVRIQFAIDLPAAFLASGGHYRNVMLFKEMIVVVVVYWCARRLVRDGTMLRFAIAGTVGGYLVAAVSGAIDVLGGVGLDHRAGGLFGQSGPLGHFVAAYTMFPAAALLVGVRPRLYIGAALAMVASVMSLMGSLSRGALLAFGGGIVSMAVVRRSIWIVVLAALVLTSPLWLPQDYLDRFNESVARDPTGLSSVPGFESAEEFTIDREVRIRIWRAGLRMVVDRPIIGVGLGQYPYSMKEYGGTTVHSSHNVLLALAAECGILAAAAHAAILLILGICALRLAGANRGKALTVFGLGMLGVTVASALTGMVNSVFYRGTHAGAFFILAGAMFNIYYHKELDWSLEPATDSEPGDLADLENVQAGQR